MDEWVLTWPGAECQSPRRETRTPMVAVAWCEILESEQGEKGRIDTITGYNEANESQVSH